MVKKIFIKPVGKIGLRWSRGLLFICIRVKRTRINGSVDIFVGERTPPSVWILTNNHRSTRKIRFSTDCCNRHCNSSTSEILSGEYQISMLNNTIFFQRLRPITD